MTSEIAELEAACRSGDTLAQIDAVLRLTEAQATEAVAAVLPLLAAESAALRCTVADALAVLGVDAVDEVAPALVERLTDPESIVRSSAIETLGALGYTPAADAIATLLRDDPDALPRASAAEVLGELGGAAALEALHRAAASDPDEAVRAYAINALGLLAEDATSLDDLPADTSERLRAELLGARYRLGDAGALAPLLDLLDGAEEPLATPILNLLDDLMSRRHPPALVADAPAIDAALAAVAHDPLLRGHATRLRLQLAALV